VIESDLGEAIEVALPRGRAAVISRPRPGGGSPNQDAALIVEAESEEVLMAVADGMGGTRRGGEAAALTVRHLAVRAGAPMGDGSFRTAILDGIESANRDLLANLPEGSTTLATVELAGHTVRPYHVGDSVILVVGQRGRLKLLTVSHSPVGLGVEAGFLDEEEALHHHERHVVFNAVGSSGMRIELGAPLELARRDTLLLASDGLTDNLTIEEIVGTIRKGRLGRVVGELADRARERMLAPPTTLPSKPDDLTIIAYRRSV